MTAARELTDGERALLELLLDEATFPGAPDLRRQVAVATVVGGLPTWLHLAVAPTTPAADVPDGHIPGRAIVQGATGQDEGEILVWVTGGRLSGLEHAWYTDQAPTSMPPVDRIRLA